MDRESFILKHINSPMAPEYMKYLLGHDTVHGRFSGTCEVDGDALIINGAKVTLSTARVPAEIPWTQTGVEYVRVDGRLTTTRAACAHRGRRQEGDHLRAGEGRGHPDARRRRQPGRVRLVDGGRPCASCTTNGLAPLVKTVNDKWGIKQGLMTTVHAATASRLTVDGSMKGDWRAGRGVGDIIPSSTGAAKAWRSATR